MSVRKQFLPGLVASLLAALFCMSAQVAHAQTQASCNFNLFTVGSSAANPVLYVNGVNDYGTVVGFADFGAGASPRFKAFIHYSNGGTHYFVPSGAAGSSFGGRNNAGLTTGDYSDFSNHLHPFLLKGSSMTPVSAPSGAGLNGINRYNSIVGSYLDTNANSHGFKRYSNGSLTYLNYPGAKQTTAVGINDSGVVVGWYTDIAGVQHGFSLAAKKFTKIDPPGSTLTNAWSINTAGVIVGTYVGSDGIFHGFVDNAGTFTTFDAPGATTTEILGVNNKNQMVGLILDSAGAQHGFTLVGTKYNAFDYPGATVTAGDRINDSGEIVGLHGTSSAGPFSGYTRVGTTYMDVSAPNSTETRVRGLNNAGTIVGRFTDSGGVIHGYQAH